MISNRVRRDTGRREEIRFVNGASQGRDGVCVVQHTAGRSDSDPKPNPIQPNPIQSNAKLTLKWIYVGGENPPHSKVGSATAAAAAAAAWHSDMTTTRLAAPYVRVKARRGEEGSPVWG